ncbi:tetratricopeptide repeat protein 5-like isoform X2 [Lineus longissimus]
MLYGRALNVLSGFNQEALELLAKAVKLDPSLVEAWNHLGECYWKNNDVKAAHNCFTGALSHSKNKVSLRNLSMVLRQLGSTSEEKLKNVEESVEKAKEAVGFDVKDGTSWFILGNAYLSLFFNMNQSPKVLKQCLSAYTQAERDAVAACNPDLHFNRSIAYKYQEDYELALIGFSRASVLDPTWSDPKDKEKNLTDYLEKLCEFIDTKGKLKGKKVQTMLKSLSGSDLGPYGGGSYTNPSGKTTKLTNVSLASLKGEKNLEKVVVGKVVCSLTSDDPVPFTFCLVDSQETCVAVTTYNIALGYGVKIGDAVAIPEPFVQDVDVHHKDKVFKFRSIRVDTPVVLVVNGRKLGLDRQAPSVLAVSAQSE